MRKRSVLAVLILAVAVFSAFAGGCAGNAETEMDMDPDEWELDCADKGPTKDIHITVDNTAYRAYDFEALDLDFELMMEDTGFFLDPEKTQDIFPTIEADNTDDFQTTSLLNTTYTLRVPKDTKDLYIVPQDIPKLEENGEQVISLEQGYPIQTDYFTVLSAYAPKTVGWRADLESGSSYGSIGIIVNLACETYRFPKDPRLKYNGKEYISYGDGSQEAFEKPVIYKFYRYEFPDLYTAAMAMKFGTLQYSKLVIKEPAKEATYACDDKTITLHVIEE